MATTRSEIVLPPLPYAANALEPHMSRETLDYHYGKHHKAYVEKLNALITGTDLEDASLEELVAESTDTVDNTPPQFENHFFLGGSLSPQQQKPNRELTRAFDGLGGLESFQSQ